MRSSETWGWSLQGHSSRGHSCSRSVLLALKLEERSAKARGAPCLSEKAECYMSRAGLPLPCGTGTFLRGGVSPDNLNGQRCTRVSALLRPGDVTLVGDTPRTARNVPRGTGVGGCVSAGRRGRCRFAPTSRRRRSPLPCRPTCPSRAYRDRSLAR